MKTVTREDYYKLIGLLAIAKEHNSALQVIERAVAQTVGVENEDNGGTYYGHASDAVWSDYSADELLSKLEIKIAEVA